MQKEVILRYCENCERPLEIIIDGGGNDVQKGIIHGDDYYCDEDCWFMDVGKETNETWEEFYDGLVAELGEDQDVAYYTEWELEEV